MGNLYEKISYLCAEKGIKGAKLCNDTGISKGLLTDLKMGRRTGVSAVTAQKIASYFGVTVGYLLGEEERTAEISNNEEKPTVIDDELSEGEKTLIELFRLVPEEKQRMVLDMIRIALGN